MKKSFLIYALFAATLIGSASSCDSGGSNDPKIDKVYDSNGHLLSETSYKYENDEWTYCWKDEHTYDDKGNEASFSSFIYENDEWVKMHEHIYINGERKDTLETYDYDKYEYTYDENGNTLTRKVWELVDNEWVKTLDSIFINGEEKINYVIYFTNPVIDPEGNFLDYSYRDGYKIHSKHEYTYDENGNILTKLVSKFIDNEWRYSYKYQYTYDDKGNNAAIITFHYENKEWSYYEKREFTYDSNGNELSSVHYIWMNNEWVKA